MMGRFMWALLASGCVAVASDSTTTPDRGIVELACPEVEGATGFALPWGAMFQTLECDDGTGVCRTANLNLRADYTLTVPCVPGKSWRILWIVVDPLTAP